MENSHTREKIVPVPPPLPKLSYYRTRLGNNKFQSRRDGFAHTVVINTQEIPIDEGCKPDVLIRTFEGDIISAHCTILGIASPVFKNILNDRRRGQRRSISIRGVPGEVVLLFINTIYSLGYEEDDLEEHALQLLALSHAYAIPTLKRLCERHIEHGWLTIETVIDIFQLAMLCDAPRLSLMCHRFILQNLDDVCATEGWRVMRHSHPILEKEIFASIIDEDSARKDRMNKVAERRTYQKLHEAMEAVVHFFQDGCRTASSQHKVLKGEQSPCPHDTCKILESLIRHFRRCKKRVNGGCINCNRMLEILELHSRMCANPHICKVPLCRKFIQWRKGENKKESIKWRTLVGKIVRSKSISGAPFFSLESA